MNRTLKASIAAVLLGTATLAVAPSLARGALGAYWAGVYEALSEAHLQPDWVAGISIGAIGADLVAGNPRESRVENLRLAA